MKAVFYAVRFRAPDLNFSDLENGRVCLRTSEYAKSDRKNIYLRIRWPKIASDLGPKSDATWGHQIFILKNLIVSELKLLSTTASSSSSRTIDEFDGVTADSCMSTLLRFPTRGRRAARLSAARLRQNPYFKSLGSAILYLVCSYRVNS